MAYIDTLKQKLKSLADENRAKADINGNLSLDDMFTAINNIPIGGKAEASQDKSLKQKLVNIANAIRAKTGDTAPLTLDEMIDEIKNLVLTLTGAVIPSSYVTIGAHNVVTRQGNVVTVDVELIPNGSVTADMPLFTLPYGWKPKTPPITFNATYMSWLGGELIVACSLNSEGKASTLEDDNVLAPANKLLCKFKFEAI